MNDGSKKVIKAGMGYTIGNYLIKGLSFLTIPIFARILDSSDYGIYNTYIAYESIIYIIIGLALHSSFKNAKYKFKEQFNDYISSTILLGIINAVVWFVCLNVFYKFTCELLGFEHWVLNLLILHSFGSALIQYYNAYVGLYYEYNSFLKISFINAFSNILGSIFLILIIFSEAKYYGRILGTALPVLALGVYIIIYFFRKARPKIKLSYWKYGLNYSLPIIPHGISQVVLAQFDRIMITSMVGRSESGIYSFAYNIYTIVQVTSSSLSNVWEPWFFEKMANKNYSEIRKKGFLFGFGMLLFSAVLCLLAPELIIILGGRKYVESVYCVIPIVIGGYFSFLYILPCEVEYYHEKTKCIAIATCFAAIINIVLNYIFIQYYGYVAAAYTTLVTYLLYFIFHYFLARKIEGRFIYSNKQISFLVIFALMFGGLSVLLINYFYIRIIIAFALVIGALIYVEKKYQIITKIKKGEIKWKN